MLARATSSVEENSKGEVEIRNSHFLSALPEGLVGNFQRAVAQQVIIGGLGNKARTCLPFKSPMTELHTAVARVRRACALSVVKKF